MCRKSLTLGVCLLAVFVGTAKADKVPNTGWARKCCVIKELNLNTSTNPPTPLQDVSFAIPDARAGTPQNPLGPPLATTATLETVNPDPVGIGDAALLDVYYTGPANDFPTDSFFDVFVDITLPDSISHARGTVRVINSAATSFTVGLGTEFSGSSDEMTTLLDGQINSAQPGLSFNGLQVVQGTSPDPFATSFFDVFVQLRFDGIGTINPNLPLFSITTSGVPEPATMGLATIGMAVVLVSVRARRRAAA